MKYILLLILLCVAVRGVAQNSVSEMRQTDDKPFIDVAGTAEREVVPDEIFIAIALRERYEGKTKINVQLQEDSLKRALREIGVQLENLSLTDANADYVRVRWGNRDVMARKDYEIKVGSADTVRKVFAVLRDLNVYDASISRVKHSKIDSIEQVVRIEAIKDSKAKASYLMDAIDGKAGKPMFIIEEPHTLVQSAYYNKYYVDGIAMRGTAAGVMADRTTIQRLSKSVASDDETYEIQFQKIKVSYNVFARFAID